jgi:hypothetical protein
MLNAIRTILQRECLVGDLHSLRTPPCANASECAARHGALVAASRVVRACFAQLDLDVRRAAADLAFHRGGKEQNTSCHYEADGVSHYIPDIDLVFTQAKLQAAVVPSPGHRESADSKYKSVL